MLTQNPKIPIQNIYYMLAYAYQTLHFKEYETIDPTAFDQVDDLYAAILALGLPTLIRGGLQQSYQAKSEISSVLRGKLNLPLTFAHNRGQGPQLGITYDEFTADNLLNQILKATIVSLHQRPTVQGQYRRKLYGFLPYFSEVSDIRLRPELWQKIHYDKQNRRYHFLLMICRYLYLGQLLDVHGQTITSRQITDEQRLSHLYEKFVYNFYVQETPYLVTHPQIPWQVDDGFTQALPVMQTDVVLQHQQQTLIIDTKFYSENMVRRFENSEAKQKTANLYQMFTYLNNWPSVAKQRVAGLLLYAKTTASTQPQQLYHIKGQKVGVQTLDLNQDFAGIKRDLKRYAALFLEN